MREFKINEKITIVCNSENARDGFRHRATLLLNGSEADSTTVHYINRTWEAYEFQTVMQKLVDKTNRLTPAEKQYVKKWLEGDRTDWSGFHTTAMVAKMGDVLMQTPKEKNAWKTRMLKAGLGNKGLDIPSDFDTLPEEVKTARLDKAISFLSETGIKKKKLKSQIKSQGLNIAKETGVWN
jgi:hypothetical protein